MSELLQLDNLSLSFCSDEEMGGETRILHDVCLTIRRGTTHALVGESGSGKSVTAMSILRLLEETSRVRTSGRILFNGTDILQMNRKELLALRGDRIAMIFQEPMTSLNPVYTIGSQLIEPLMLHRNMDREEARQRALHLMERTGIEQPEFRYNAYPHQLSGGQRQRVMIAMALACRPDLLIADEPTTALDVTIQAQILALMRDLRTKLNTSVILITHDLGVIAEMADRVAVMYAGRIVEQTDVYSLFEKPLHPYTRGLIASIPVLGQVKERLAVIPGSVPNLVDLPPGCRFAPRCEARIKHQLTICTEIEPELQPAMEGHLVRCWLYHNHEDHQAPLQADEVGAVE